MRQNLLHLLQTYFKSHLNKAEATLKKNTHSSDGVRVLHPRERTAFSRRDLPIERQSVNTATYVKYSGLHHGGRDEKNPLCFIMQLDAQKRPTQQLKGGDHHETRRICGMAQLCPRCTVIDTLGYRNTLPLKFRRH